MTKMEIHNLGKAPAPFGNKIHIMLIFLLQLFLSCNPQKTNDGILSKEILYGEWALVDGEHQVNYPNIEFFADSSAILYSQADTIYRFTFFIRNDSICSAAITHPHTGLPSCTH